MAVNQLAMICTLFLVIYNQLVCPFLESRSFMEELANLLIVFLVMILIRGEQISSRITWGNFIYAFVPSMAMLITVLRYAIQDMMIPLAISGEIAYIGTIFVVIGSTVNIAIRLESQAKKHNPPIIFSREVADKIGGEFETVIVGEEELKRVGRQKMFTIRGINE